MGRFHPLGLIADHPKPVLVAGLAIGIAVPGLARILSSWIPEMVVGLLFLGTLRLSPSGLRDLRTRVPAAIGLILTLQLALPLALLGVAWAVGAANTPLTLALVLLACAPPIVSSPNIAAIMRLDASVAMQLMVVGSVLLPLTSLPVFWLMPALGSADLVFGASLRLLVTIVVAGGGAILLRRIVLPDPGPQMLRRLDGLSVLALAIFVIALMPAVSGAIANDAATFLFWMMVAFGANFGLQIAMLWLGRNTAPAPVNGARALIAGNRNISLFFVALPQEVTAPLLVFLGCYQLPMLLTPVLLSRLYSR